MTGRDQTDGASDELEPGAALAAEIQRVVQDPREEAQRLHSVAEVGERGSAPFIEIGAVARRLVPLVLLMIGLISAVYYLAGRI
jgi:hypothetical protein